MSCEAQLACLQFVYVTDCRSVHAAAAVVLTHRHTLTHSHRQLLTGCTSISAASSELRMYKVERLPAGQLTQEHEAPTAHLCHNYDTISSACFIKI